MPSAILLVVVLLVAAGCAGSSSPDKGQPPAETANTSEPEAAEPSAGPSSDTEAAASSADAGATTAAPPPAAPTPLEVCGQMCERMGQRCAATVVKSCKLTCKKYEKLPAGCDAEARAALECARDADDLQCAAIAPVSCNPVFLRFAACTRGEKIETKAEGPKIPEGWERFSAKGAGFSALMPRSVVESTEGGDPTFKAEAAPVTYSVRVRKAPEEKPTQKVLVKAALDLLGVNCSKNLRLHGMIEQAQRVTIRFDSQCKNGTEWRGQFVVARGKLYVLALTGPNGFKAEHEAFFSSFDAS
jgi:hypothetical protein